MGMGKPKFDKVDANTIRITIEKTDDIALINIVKNREYLEQQKAQVTADYKTKLAQIETTLKNIDEVLEVAKKLGIVPKEEPKTEGKK